MQSIFNISQAEVENLLKDHETEEVSIQVQMSKSENLPSTVTEEPSQFDSQFGESQLGDTSGTFPYIQNQNIFFVASMLVADISSHQHHCHQSRPLL